jgi:hypothetical protein
MADVSTHEDFALSAQDVWDAIGDFGGIRKWAPVIEKVDIEDSPGGAIRVLTLGDGSVVREALIASSQYSYSYTILDRPATPDYRGTVAVIPLDSANSRIVLIVHLSATSELSDEDITARYSKFVAGNMKAMKRAIEAR